jgi:polar amino acid transport system substrate-binding protein
MSFHEHETKRTTVKRQPDDPRVTHLVRAGTIRVALFLPQYANDPLTGELRGVGTGIAGIAFARALAAQIGIEARIDGYPTPAAVVESLKAGSCDMAFLGIEPSRAAELDFSPPLFQFDYSFLVPPGSSIQRVPDADRSGLRIAVVRNHASTLALSRIVTHAELIGSELPDAAFELLRAGGADALAFPRDVLSNYSAKLPGSRVLEDSYGVNRVGAAIRKGQAGLLAYIGAFVAETKASGMIQRAIERGGLLGFRVEPDAKS